MKKFVLFLSAAVLFAACDQKPAQETPLADEPPISICSPKPSEIITKVSLSEEERGYVHSGNTFSLRLLKRLYAEKAKSMVCSPLSIQYAMGMTANGAHGDTQHEIITTLNCGIKLAQMNAYFKALMEQFPALDPNVALMVTDAMLIREGYQVKNEFRLDLARYYYAPVETISSDPLVCMNRINEWASRNTNGLIDPFLDEPPIDADAVLMNALYFKAPWADEDMFNPDATQERDFHLSGGGVARVPMMEAHTDLAYADFDGFQSLAIPYASGKFSLYILLPDEGVSFDSWMEGIDNLNITQVMAQTANPVPVHLVLPKFDLSSGFTLNDALQALGIQTAFSDGADFSLMLQNGNFHITRVLQKAKISLSEWGTEAGAVTVVTMEKSSGGGSYTKFFADRPFTFVLAENTTGAVLFEGVYTGSK